MIKVSITRTTRNLEELIKKLEDLEGEYVETGVFVEQGIHPTAEVSYVDLAFMHEEGDGNFPPRTVRNVVLNSLKDNKFLSQTEKYLNNYLYKGSSLNYTLGRIGQTMSFIGKSFFGQTFYPDMPMNHPDTIQDKGFNAPLVETGALRDAWAYRTSVNNYIVDSDYV